MRFFWPAILASLMAPTAIAAEQPATTPFRSCINLGNALEAPAEGAWGYTVRARDLATIRSGGFDAVRLPVAVTNYLGPAPDYRLDPRLLQRVDEILTWAERERLIVLLDLHHVERIHDQPARETPRVVAIWRQLAEHYKARPESLYFEIINEPHGRLGGQLLVDFYAAVLPTIRATNPTRKIVVSGDRWGSIQGLDALTGLDPTNLIATFHYYDPFEFTHQGLWWGAFAPPLGAKWGGRQAYAKVDADMASAAAQARALGMPLLLGEFGVLRTVKTAQRASWTAAVRRSAERHAIAWCSWDFAGAFPAYDLTHERWIEPILDALKR
jgi:endoglucanase